MSVHPPTREESAPHASEKSSDARSRRAASRGAKLIAFLFAGHGLFVLVKVLAIGGAVTFFGAIQMKFGWAVAAIVLFHASVIVALVLVYRHWRRGRKAHE